MVLAYELFAERTEDAALACSGVPLLLTPSSVAWSPEEIGADDADGQNDSDDPGAGLSAQYAGSALFRVA